MASGQGVKGSAKLIRQITFIDKPDVRTHVISDCLFQRQTPPSSFLTCTAVGREVIVDSDYAYYSDHSAAVARSKALDLLSAWAVDGRKVLPLVPNEQEVDLSSEFVAKVGKEQSCEMPLTCSLLGRRPGVEFCS